MQLGRDLVNTRLFGQAGQAVELRDGQLRNAVAVANETARLEVVKNWVLYQVGRPDGRGWRQGGFADGLVGHLDGDLDRLAGTVATNPGLPDRQRDAHLRLTRLYLGYLSRALSYRQQERERPAPGAPPAPGGAGRSQGAPVPAWRWRPPARARSTAGRPTPPATGPAPAPPDRPTPPTGEAAPVPPPAAASPPAGDLPSPAAIATPPAAEPPPTAPAESADRAEPPGCAGRPAHRAEPPPTVRLSLRSRRADRGGPAASRHQPGRRAATRQRRAVRRRL